MILLNVLVCTLFGLTSCSGLLFFKQSIQQGHKLLRRKTTPSFSSPEAHLRAVKRRSNNRKTVDVDEMDRGTLARNVDASSVDTDEDSDKPGTSLTADKNG